MSTPQQPNLNQAPKALLALESITDLAIRNNFELINRELLRRQQNAQLAKANIVFGEPIALAASVTDNDGTAAIKLLGPVVSITTHGNPVRIKLASYALPSGSTVNPIFSVVSASSNTAYMLAAWQRNGTKISSCQIGIKDTPPAGTTSAIEYRIPLPAFEFDDLVPSGTYSYQFYYMKVSGSIVTYGALQVVAYELT